MESLIIFIIIGIISSIFGKFKQQQEQPKKQMPPFNQNSMPSQPTQAQMQEPRAEHPKPRSFEDFAKEIFGEIEAKPMPIPEKIEPTPIPVVVQPENALEDRTQAVLKRKALENRVDGHSSTSTGRLGAMKEVERSTSSTLKPEIFVKPSSNSLVQAIVMADVLGPPKARQKR